MLIERVVAFIRGKSGESFDDLALALLRHGRGEIGPGPAEISDWRLVPPVPTSLLASDPAARALDTDLRQAVIDHSFPAACLRGMGRPPVLSLVPTGADAAETHTASTADRLLRAWAATDSLALTRGVDVAPARSFLGARQRDRRPTLLLATAATLERLLRALDRRGLRFRLPPGSRVIQLGDPEPPSPGIEGAAAGAAPLLTRLAEGLALPAEGVIREYGVEGIATRFYGGHAPGGDPLPFQPPPWVRLRVLDTETLAEAPAGASGALAAFDLTAPDSAAYRLTRALATAVEGGFHLGGSAPAPPG